MPLPAAAPPSTEIGWLPSPLSISRMWRSSWVLVAMRTYGLLAMLPYRRGRREASEGSYAFLAGALHEAVIASKGGGGTVTALADERQAQLDALLDALRNLPTPEMIVRCREAVGADPTVEAGLARIHAANAGAWAFDRMTSYLDRLRSLNAERK